MQDWNQKLMETIRKQKEQEKSEDRDNLLRLTSHKLYGGRAHFALELIQNAEDEASNKVVFVINNGYVVIINNGRPFDEKDVWGICSIRPGRKKNKIGFFGLGFKSVFKVTEKPQIISADYNFTIKNFIYPYPQNSIPDKLEPYFKKEKGAIFVLPIEKEKYNDLKEDLSQIDSKILLFLEHIEQLIFIDEINGDKWEIRKDRNGETIRLFDTRTNDKSEWKVFHKNIKVVDEKIVPEDKSGIEETRITIALPTDESQIEKLRKNGVIYCYLPTKQRADLGFLIQADFVPTIGRENITEVPWNVWLMEQLGIFAAEIFDQIKNSHLLARLYDFIPLREEVNETLVEKHFVESLISELKNKKILKSENGWKKPEECVMTDNQKVRDIFSEKDIKIVFKEKLYFVDLNFLKEESKDRRFKLLQDLGVKKIDDDKIIMLLEKSKNLNKKPKEWFLNLYDYLATAFDPENKWRWDDRKKELYHRLLRSRLILTYGEKTIPIQDPNKPDRLICYPQKRNLKEIRKLFSEGEIVFIHPYFQESSIFRRKDVDEEAEGKRKKIKEWFDKIGVRKYFKEVHVIRDVIAEKFATGKFANYNEQKLLEFIEYIKNHWNLVETELKNKKIAEDKVEQIKESIYLKAYRYENGKKIYDYKKPSEIYFSKHYGKNETMEDLFEGIEGVYFLSPIYLKLDKKKKSSSRRPKKRKAGDWKDFFTKIGVWSSPIAKIQPETDISSNPSFKWVKREHSTSYEKINNDAESKDIKKLLEYCSGLNYEESKKRMILLWESLRKNWKIYKDKYCNARYLWKYRHPKQKDLHDSTFLQFLKRAEWLPGSDGKFHKPSDMILNTKKNKTLMGENCIYLELNGRELKGQDSFIKDLGVKLEPSIDDVIDHLKEYRSKNENLPESEFKKSLEKMEAVYLFLKEKINEIDDEKKINSISTEFKKEELIFLPRTDKQWWNPEKVFWTDFSDKLPEFLRGFVQTEIYPIYTDNIKKFFLQMGVKDKPNLNDCVEIIEEIKMLKLDSNDDLKNIIRKINFCMNEIIKLGSDETLDFKKEIFLSEKMEFKTPDKIFYCNDEDIKEAFNGEVDFLIEMPESKVIHLLKKACIKKFEDIVKVEKNIINEVEIEGGIVKDVISRLSYCEIYLEKNHPDILKNIDIEKISKKIRNLQLKKAGRINIKYIWQGKNNGSKITKEIEKECFYDKENETLYTRIDIFSSEAAREISKIFSEGKDEAFPFISTIFRANNEEELEQILKHFHIKMGEKLSGATRKKTAKILREPYESVEKSTKIGVPVKDIPTESQGSKVPKLPEEKSIGSDLIDPEDYIFDEHILKPKSDNVVNTRTEKSIQLKEGSKNKHVFHLPRTITPRYDAELIAIELAIRYEKLQNREAEDRHTQKCIGYDVYSKDKDGNERFIEVKHFRGSPGIWRLTSKEWEKAIKEMDKYFVYIVSGLKTGETPLIQIIQNPFNSLTPDPQKNITFSNWKNSVKEEIKLKPLIKEKDIS